MIKKLTLLLIVTTLSVVASENERKVLVVTDETKTKMSIDAEEMAHVRAQSVQAEKPAIREAVYKPSK